jgi:hypothetical protein
MLRPYRQLTRGDNTMTMFDYKSDRLYGEGVSLETVAARFGTPTYVYSRAAIVDNYRRMAEGLARVPNLICYSVKANSSLRILRLLREAGAGFDIVSAGELARVLRAGADPSRVVFSGVGKTAEEIDAGLAAGILMFNVESSGELEVLESRAKALGKTAALSIRVNPDVVAETHPYISTGQIVHKFGVPKDEAIELYRRVARSDSLRARGVTCHIGSQRWMKFWTWRNPFGPWPPRSSTSTSEVALGFLTIKKNLWHTSGSSRGWLRGCAARLIGSSSSPDDRLSGMPEFCWPACST